MNDNKISTKPGAFKVNPDDPFDGDALGRRELCEGLENFIENSTTPYTLAVTASWGSGKTVFLQILEAYLRKQGFQCVFFDAWKADFYDNALPALIGEIEKQIKEIPEDFSDKAKQLGKTLVSLDTVLAVVTALAKALPGGEEATGAISKAVEKSFQEHNSIEHYIEYKKALKEFKESLESFALDKENGQPENSKPLVILVDELDRCRPDFALDVLEKIKHVFDIESVFFAFGLNKEELEKTIKTVYGEIDTKRYFRKFFDETINLVNTTNLLGQAMHELSLVKLLEKENERHVNKYGSGLRGILDLFFEMFKPTPRDQQQILSSIKVSLLMAPPHEPVFPVLLFYFATIRLINHDLFQKSKIGANQENLSSFPYEEHFKFYRDHAGFSNHEELYTSSYSKYREPYVLLHAIHYRNSDEYKQEVCKKKDKPLSDDAYARLAQQGRDENKFWESICQVAEDQTSHADVPEDMDTFINRIDSVGKLIPESEAEKGK